MRHLSGRRKLPYNRFLLPFYCFSFGEQNILLAFFQGHFSNIKLVFVVVWKSCFQLFRILIWFGAYVIMDIQSSQAVKVFLIWIHITCNIKRSLWNLQIFCIRLLSHITSVSHVKSHLTLLGCLKHLLHSGIISEENWLLTYFFGPRFDIEALRSYYHPFNSYPGPSFKLNLYSQKNFLFWWHLLQYLQPVNSHCTFPGQLQRFLLSTINQSNYWVSLEIVA